MATRHLMTGFSELEPIVNKILNAAWNEGHNVGYETCTKEQIHELCSLDENVKVELETARKDLVAASKAERKKNKKQRKKLKAERKKNKKQRKRLMAQKANVKEAAYHAFHEWNQIEEERKRLMDQKANVEEAADHAFHEWNQIEEERKRLMDQKACDLADLICFHSALANLPDFAVDTAVDTAMRVMESEYMCE